MTLAAPSDVERPPVRAGVTAPSFDPGAGRRYRAGVWAAGSTLLGIVLSGPLALLVVNATHPQPAWRDAEVFARSYHPIQLLPFAGGLVLIAGLISLLTSVRMMAGDELKLRSAMAQVFVSVFAAFIFFNYVVQATYVPGLVRDLDGQRAGAIATLSMANPTSLAWAIEMWGYAFLGIATWLVAPVFHRGPLERATAWTFVANGPVSLAGGVWTAVSPGWVVTPAGYVAFSLWNVLLAVLAALALIAFRRRARERFAATMGVQ